MSTVSDSPSSWQRNLRAIWFAELVAIVGFSVVIPILPLYVRELGVQGEREVRIWSGVIFSAQAVTMAVFGPIWGALSDRYGRKLMVERAMFAGSVLMTLMGLIQTPGQLAFLRALQGALTGTVTAATALVAASTPSERSGYALGTLQMAVYVGASAGPLLGGVVADTLGYRSAFFVTGALLLLAALGVLVFVKEPSQAEQASNNPTPPCGHGARPRQGVLGPLTPILASAPLLTVLAIHMVMRLAARLVSPILSLFIESIATPGARVATLTGVISGANAVGGAIGGLTLGQLGDRVGYRRILAICALVSMLCYAPQSAVDRSVWLVPLQAGAGLAMGGMLASISASLATLAPQGREGIVYGVDASAVSLANAIGPMAGSTLAAWKGLRAPFVAAALVFGLGCLVTLRLVPRAGSSTS